MTQAEAIEHIKTELAKSQSVAQWCRKTGLSPSYVHDVLKGARPPSKRLMSLFGMSKEVRYFVREGGE